MSDFILEREFVVVKISIDFFELGRGFLKK